MEDLHGFGIQKVPSDPLCGLTPWAPDLRVAFVHCLVLPGVPWRIFPFPAASYFHNFGTGPASHEKSHTGKIYVLRCANGHGLSRAIRLLSSLPRRARRDPPRPNQIPSNERDTPDPCCWGNVRLIGLTRCIGDGICLVKTDSFLHRDIQFAICFQQFGFGRQVALVAIL